MQLTAALLLIGCLTVSAAGSSQTITLSGRDIAYERIFSAIKEQTGYVVMSTRGSFSRSDKLTISVEQMGLLDFLELIFRDMPYEYEIRSRTIFIKERPVPKPVKPSTDWLSLHEPPVSGVVRGPDGQPLAGVNIMLKGTKKGTTTNKDGSFSIDAKENDVLLISSVGYAEKQVTVGKNGEIGDILMVFSNSKLDEVQVIAYGQTSRRLNTGNVTTVTSAEIERQPVSNPLLALAGRVPGLVVTQTSGLPGAPVIIQLRGQNSMARNGQTLIPTQPMYVVDGLPVAGNVLTFNGPFASSDGGFANMSAFSYFNPNDIQSIEILKDADATAIYGSRGANGVILITTKKGKASAPKFDLNVESGISWVGKRISLLDTKQYLQMRREAFYNDGKTDLEAEMAKDPRITAILYKEFAYWDSTRNVDWQDRLIGGTAQNHRVQASLGGGANNFSYLLNGSYNKSSTVFPGDKGQQQASVSLSVNSSSANQKLKLNARASYLSDWVEYPRQDLTAFILMAPNAPEPYNPDGTLNFGVVQVRNATGLHTVSQYDNNPFTYTLRPYTNKTANLTGAADISYLLAKGLSISTTVGYNEIRADNYTVLVNYASLSEPNQNSWNPRLASFGNTYSKNLSIEPQLNYHKAFGRASLDWLLAASYQYTSSSSLGITASGYSEDAIMNTPATAPTQRSSTSFTEYKYNAGFTRISFNWAQKYLLNLNARRDGSSRFGPGRQFGNFGSVGAAWILTEEPWLRSMASFLSFAKLRGSFGTSGNDGIGDYQYIERYSPLYWPYQGANGYISSGLTNPDYRWETTIKAELGLSLGFFNDRLLMELSLYRNRAKDQLLPFPLPSLSGIGSVTVNSPAVLQNQGLELALTSTNIQTKDFRWSTGFNISFNRNKLVAYPGLEKSPYYFIYRIGEPVDMMPIYKLDGVDAETGYFVFDDGSGKSVFADELRYEDAIRRKRVTPDYIGGFSNSFSYKGLSLELHFQFTKQVGMNYLFTPPYMHGAGSNVPIEVDSERWRKPGDQAKLQKASAYTGGAISDRIALGYNYARMSDAAYTDASFIRLKNVALSYMVPARLLSRLHLGNLQVYMNSQNLLTISNYLGPDPENQTITALPPLRSIVAGIRLTL
ncbi:MAG: SusC/RagA family TonB-linked outer membrane protein [Candidatus Pseudobacter hemicellulosilyticus]|uniref:SusC/RagA family TonB-linked outer membrane protein n=1 Tax=Candidatus Pseudobacter hemicellulosilyticus TaxID=3121375 RepID=A0AAJ5WWJ3_9BACT|nr:MAG: SusC/RagA family TonB-linked outer membrane protein [Pseudobacter sp.]